MNSGPPTVPSTEGSLPAGSGAMKPSADMDFLQDFITLGSGDKQEDEMFGKPIEEQSSNQQLPVTS